MRRTTHISLRINPVIKERLERLARAVNRTQSYLIENAIESYLDLNEWQIQEIKNAVQEADSPNAEWIDHQSIKEKWESKLAD